MRPFEAARAATAEIGLAVMATTFSLVVIFVPVSFMSSISGRFLYQFGITAAVAVLVSLLVSFTLTPMMSARLLRVGGGGHEPKSRGGFYRLIDAGYTVLLRACMAQRWLVAGLALLVMASSVPLYKFVRQEYLPKELELSRRILRRLVPIGHFIKQFKQKVFVHLYPGIALNPLRLKSFNRLLPNAPRERRQRRIGG